MNSRYRQIEMPFGKYRGCRIEDVPIDYLWWCSRNMDLREPLRTAIQQELSIDRDESSSQADPQQLSGIVDRWYRTLAIEFHPDRRNGSVIGMQAVNRAAELLRQMVGT